MEGFKPKIEVTDMQRAMFLVGLLEKSCRNKEEENLRQKYTIEAKAKLVPTLTDPVAKKIVELVLEKYRQ